MSVTVGEDQGHKSYRPLTWDGKRVLAIPADVNWKQMSRKLQTGNPKYVGLANGSLRASQLKIDRLRPNEAEPE